MGGKKETTQVKRTQKDLSMKVIAFGSIFTLLLTFVFFLTDVMHGNWLHSIVAILLVAGISFLFTTVAANAIAIVGTNPVSGMTLMTLILASVVMVAVGLKGATGMVAALVMGKKLLLTEFCGKLTDKRHYDNHGSIADNKCKLNL